MGYDRDERYGPRYRDNRAYGDRHRGMGRSGYGRDYDEEDRGFFDRAADEVRSWFGDDEAERRRDRDERSHGRETRWRGDDSFGGGWGNQTPRGRRDEERYARPSGFAEGYGERGVGPSTADAPDFYSAPGYDGEFEGPRFDRLDPGSVGTHGVHPVSSSSGGMYGASAGGYRSSARRYAMRRARGGSDPHYAEWRQRQIDEIDRDYDDYRREHQAKFENEFGTWRQRRGEQRSAMNRVTEHMEVVGSDDQHIGTVDKVRGERIILTKTDENAGGVHHSIPCSWIESVDDKVKVNKTADQAMAAWREEERNRALFEREDSGSGGPHALNRSFSGTYSDRD